MRITVPEGIINKIENKSELHLLWKLWIMADDSGIVRFCSVKDLSVKLDYAYPYLLLMLKKLHDKGCIYKTRGLIQIDYIEKE
mgnify:FL=1